MRIRALIDSGSHLVIIDAALAQKLSLSRHQLQTPLEVNLAMGGGEKSLLLTEWVAISLLSICSPWKSRTMCAIVAHRLVCPVILGHPFLSSNQIIIDHETSTCTSKHDGFKLISETQSLCKDIKDNQMLKELLARTKNIKERLDVTTKDQRMKTTLAAVRTQIECIANAEQLAQLNDEMRKKFADRFPAELPPIDELPTDVYHRFKLKDPNKLITRRQYSCPRKYREVWQTLLQQHLDAGCIHPSSSQYASPAFIILKADLKVLPRWVNDYRELNSNTVPDNHPLPRVDDILADCAKGSPGCRIK